MKPPNTRPPLILADGAGVRCKFYAFGDGGIEKCEQQATTRVSTDECYAFDAWKDENPKAIIGLQTFVNQTSYCCDRHYDTIRNSIRETW